VRFLKGISGALLVYIINPEGWWLSLPGTKGLILGIQVIQHFGFKINVAK